MIIESITPYPTCQEEDILKINYAPSIDTLVFELSDLAQRPVINVHISPIRYFLNLEFVGGYRADISSPHKDLIRYVLKSILMDVDVLESDIRRLFPELHI